MGRIYVEFVNGRAYRCKCCGCHLATVDELLSKQFHSKNGRAYLFNVVVNVSAGPREKRLMTTGAHMVRDIFCVGCMFPVGWKYEEAYERAQKYKEGKFILERSKLDVDSNASRFFEVLQDSDCENVCP
ncbi:hypothetical protein BSKO_04605 [Bryopsis sp. KO-2023]|nr:hypothetical protein BSKO_04605 [Bryopsis sp. KO-2023]